ncbi:hypothetical protein B8W73_16165 [Arthrobacter agilis]|nr:hypothetical protein B8W73_16165 [Arthrobacter agilis]
MEDPDGMVAMGAVVVDPRVGENTAVPVVVEARPTGTPAAGATTGLLKGSWSWTVRGPRSAVVEVVPETTCVV